MGIKFIIEKKQNQNAYGTITWSEKKLKSGAVSGPYGKGELPLGLYHAVGGKLVKSPKEGFCDSLKNCWFQLIEPQFSTDRTGLGIHPDGNVSGTQGCIGLLDSDTSAWYAAFKSIPAGTIVMVEVL
ncbi:MULTISPECIES: hypothetical protein [Sphingobacterium]|uniref:hypothetical protein n=1 Tax=Sphingobacterium TaxID=28453 RepID=UPI0019643E88|nr:hypothetical protein [Sphingobacterium siyangense]QRY56343.1 hypothetical protein JVX97_20305 [Sphingobacterium siyangense]